MLKRWSGLVMVILGASFAAAQDPEAEMRFNAGVRLLRDGFPDRALQEIQEALKKDPKNSFYLKGLGLTYSQLADRCKPADTKCRNENLNKAVDAAQRALLNNPDYVDVRNDLGISLLRLGRRSDGKAELAKAFADPQLPTPEITAMNLAQAFFEEKEYNEALTWYQAALNKSKELAAAYVGIADVLVITNQLDSAVLNLEAGVKQTNGNVMVQLALGDVYVRAGRFQDARATLEQVVRKDPAGVAGRQATEKLKTLAR